MFNAADYVVNGIAVVVGWVAGIASKVISDRYTDMRRHREAEAKRQSQFEECRAAMPKLIEEMAQDLANARKYEFFVYDVRLVYNGFRRDAFVYATNEEAKQDYLDEKKKVWVHANLLNKVRMLENHGFLSDITANTAPHFRMSEEFVRLVKDYAARHSISATTSAN